MAAFGSYSLETTPFTYIQVEHAARGKGLLVVEVSVVKGRGLGIRLACALELVGMSLFVIDSLQSMKHDGRIPFINWAVLCGLGALAVTLVVLAKFVEERT